MNHRCRQLLRHLEVCMIAFVRFGGVSPVFLSFFEMERKSFLVLYSKSQVFSANIFEIG